MIESSLHHGETISVPVRPFARIARSVAGYGVATALMLVSPAVVFAPASVFHCAMRNGRRAAWAAALLGVALAGFAHVITIAGGGEVKAGYTSFLAIALSIALPSMMAVPLVDRREKFGTVLAFALVCSFVGLSLTELIMHSVDYSPYAVQVAETTKLVNSMVSDRARAAATESAIARAGLWITGHLPVVVPAMLLVNIALVFILSLMMYGRLSAWGAFAATRVADSETRRTYLFRNLALPEWMLFLFIAGGATPLLSGALQIVAANLLAIMIGLYILQGLAVFRSMLVRGGAGLSSATLGFVLLFLLCVFGIGLLLLAGVGLFDSFLDFRHLNRKDDSHESHTD